jgi:predicted ABC-type ATPase
VNADEIARGLSPFNPESMAIEAGRLMLQRIEDLLAKDKSFSIETTLATKSYINLVRRAQAQGYSVRLLFFWLNSPEAAIKRVAKRVSESGHNIPREVIIRRYNLGIQNLFNPFMEKVDSWMLIDNSQNPRVIVADDSKIYNQELYKTIKSYVKK